MTAFRSKAPALRHGTPLQNAQLYGVACEFEVALRDYYKQLPVVGEDVNFYDHQNEESSGQVIRVHNGAPNRFDIQVKQKGSTRVKLFNGVRRERIWRKKRYLAADADWVSYACEITGFARSEVRAGRNMKPKCRLGLNVCPFVLASG